MLYNGPTMKIERKVSDKLRKSKTEREESKNQQNTKHYTTMVILSRSRIEMLPFRLWWK